MDGASTLVCIAWAREASRPQALAAALGGQARTFYSLGIQRRALVPLRYLLSAGAMLWWLIRTRPGAIVMQAPPAPAAAAAWLWARIASVPIVLDTHPASFQDDGPDGLMRPVLAWLAPRSRACLVTTPRLADKVSEWGGTPLIVHEAPMPWATQVHARAPTSGSAVLFVSTFAPDEPLDAVLDAARGLPDVEFRVTGDLRRLAPDVRAGAPANVRFLGFLATAEYVAALLDADVVMSLSRRHDAVQRSAHEAVDALAPLVISDAPHMRSLFPDAVRVSNDAIGIVAGVRDALDRREELLAAAPAARDRQHRRWAQQLVDLRQALRSPAST